MNNLDRFKRRLSALEREDEASKRRRVMGAALGIGANAFLHTSNAAAVSAADEALAAAAHLSPAARLPSLVGSSFTLPAAPCTREPLRQLYLPSAAPVFSRATLEEMALNNMRSNSILGSSGLSSGLPSTALTDLLRAKQEEQAQRQATDLLIAAKREEEETHKQLTELLRQRDEAAAAHFLNTHSRPSFGTTVLRHQQDPAPNKALLCRGFPSSLKDHVQLTLPSDLQQGLLRPDPSGWTGRMATSQDDLDMKATQLSDMPSLKSLTAPTRMKPRQLADLSHQCQFLPSGAEATCHKTLEELKPGKDFNALGIQEDSNWLSEMHCFLRSEIVEVFHVENSKLTGRSTSKGLSAKQVGIRCRWCAESPPESRVSRSSAFPSSLRQLYQSFTMMVRDHFGPHNMCTAIPQAHQEHLNHLRHSRNSQGASDSKHYWVHAAQTIGMVDTNEGIQITDESKAQGKEMGNFGSPQQDDAASDDSKQAPVELLVQPEDLHKGSMFLYSLLLQTQLVHLQKSELVAKRRTLPEGLEGIGCRHCCAAGRFGFSRRFPLRRRSLPEEVMDMYCHMKRCPLCPTEVKELLSKLHAEHESAKMTGAAHFHHGHHGKDGRGKDPHRDFFDVLWTRLRRNHDIKT